MTNLQALSVVREEVNRIEDAIERRRLELKKRADDLDQAEVLSPLLNPRQSTLVPGTMTPLSGGGSGVGVDGGGDVKGNGSKSTTNNSVRKPDTVTLQSIPANETRHKSGLVFGILCVFAFATAGYLYAYHTQRSCFVDEFRFTH